MASNDSVGFQSEENVVEGPSDPGTGEQQEQTGKTSDIPPLSHKRKESTGLSTDRGEGKKSKISEVWNHFTEVSGCPIGQEKASCKHCGQVYRANPHRNGTSALRHHLKICTKLPNRDLKQSILSFDPPALGGKLKAIAFTQEEGHKHLAMMIIKDELPFKVVEGEGFIGYSKYINPRFDIPHRTTLAKDCMRLYKEEMMRVKKSLRGQRLSFTTDTWTSIQTKNYMCLTGHWIDKDWKYQKRILNFCQIDSHTGETIGDTIEQCLIQWGIEKILAITVDNASSNDSAIRNLKSSTSYKLKSIVSNHDHLHMRCCAHILNLVVRSGMLHINESIMKIRKAVKYVTSSAPRLKFFGDCVKASNVECKKGLSTDVDTRWNSTYLMLEAAEKYERAFSRLERDDGRFLGYFINPSKDRIDEENAENEERTTNVLMPPDKEDWANARALLKFLKMFYEITRKFSTSLSVTTNEFFHDFVYMRRALERRISASDRILASIVTKMLVKFNKYWGKFESINGLLYVAVILDPRYKSMYVRRSLEQLYDEAHANAYADKVDTLLSKLYMQYEERYRKSSFVASSSSQHADVNIEDDEIVSDDDDMEDLKFRNAWEKQILVDKSSETISCLAKYLQDPIEPNSDTFDILSWWKVNAGKYPIMAEIARDVLAIPVSTVASESAFSTGGRVLDPHRSSLKPTTVQPLVCAQNWLRSNPRTTNEEDEDPLDEDKILKELEDELEVEDDS